MPDRHVEVFAGAMAPMAAVAAHRRVEVPDRQHGAAQRPAALVERHQIGGRAVAGLLAIRLQQPRFDVRLAEPLAFQRQIAELVHRVGQPQVAVELQAVGDDEVRLEVDVLRPQIAVSLEDASGPDALVKPPPVDVDVARQAFDGTLHEIARQSRFRALKLARGVGKRSPEAPTVVTLQKRFGGCFGVERRHPLGDGPHLAASQPAGQRQRLQGAGGRQAPHRHQPLDGVAVFAEGQGPAGVAGQREDAEIDVGRQPPVQPDLLLAEVPAPLQGREIQALPADRLLHLVGTAVGQEHPRHAGLARADRPRIARVGGRTRQERHLLREPHGLGLDRGLRRRQSAQQRDDLIVRHLVEVPLDLGWCVRPPRESPETGPSSSRLR